MIFLLGSTGTLDRRVGIYGNVNWHFRSLGAMADDTDACASFHALYALPSAHVSIIARLMATLQERQPRKVKLTVYCAQNHVCIERA
jgi:hypothetical protein